MFLLSSSTFLATTGATVLSVLATTDEEHRVRNERLEKKDGQSRQARGASARPGFFAASARAVWQAGFRVFRGRQAGSEGRSPLVPCDAEGELDRPRETPKYGATANDGRAN